MDSPSIIALIPARGGSKGIPRKNMALCAGKPLIQYTFEAARQSSRLSGIFLSTDDQEIAEFGRRHGIEVPFLRPPALAGDQTPMIDVIRHFMSWLDKHNIPFDGVMLLQPTSPLRTALHIDESITLFEQEKPNSLVSVVKVPHNFTPTSLMHFQDGKLTPCTATQIYRRQDKPTYYARNGPAILIVTKAAMEAGTCYALPCVGYEMEMMSSVDVDDSQTILFLEMFLLKNL